MQFHPDVLVATSSSALLAQILEVAAIKACYFALAAEGVTLLDLVSYTGYKYVGLTINTVVGLLLGSTAYYVCLFYTGASMAFALINTLIPILASPEPRAGAAGGVQLQPLSPAAIAQRKNVIVAHGLAQIALMWWLGSF